MYSTVILAAGTGSRCNLGYNKLLYKINGRMLIEYTIEKFDFSEVILVVSKSEEKFFKEIFPNLVVVVGGKTRQQSVCNGIRHCSFENVLIHDGARIFVDCDTINRVKQKLATNFAVVPCVKVKDSIKDNCGKNILRDNLNIAQTPQGVKKQVYLECIKNECSDDVSVIEQCGYDVCMVLGDYANIKITTMEDIKYAEYILGGIK